MERPGRRKTVIAQEFVLTDEDGAERAALRMDSAQNVVLLFRDPRGDIKLHAGVSATGTPRVDLHYASGKGSIQLEADDQSNTAALTVTGPGGTVRAAMGVTRNGTPVIVLLDEEGKVVFPSEATEAETTLVQWAGDNWRELFKE